MEPPNPAKVAMESSISMIALKDGNAGKLKKISDDDSKFRQRSKLFRGHTFCLNPQEIGFFNFKTIKENDMSFLGISGRSKSHEKLGALNTLLSSLTPGAPERTEILISKHLQQLKSSVCVENPKKSNNEKELLVLAETMVKTGLVSNLIMKLPLLTFEDRKLTTLLFCNLLRRRVSEAPVVKYIEQNPKLLFSLLDGYQNQTVALTGGRILRECIRYESLAKIFMNSNYFYEVFEYLKQSTFEISSDAFLTLQAILTEHKTLTNDYLNTHYEKFFLSFDNLLTCDNYVTKLSSIKLLGTMLLDRPFFDLMKRYVAGSGNLKRIILLMSCSNQHIQLEAYHVFKIFIANPNPTAQVYSIFTRNKERLIKLLSLFEYEQYGDQFTEEKAYLIKQLRDMDKNREQRSDSSSSSGSQTE